MARQGGQGIWRPVSNTVLSERVGAYLSFLSHVPHPSRVNNRYFDLFLHFNILNFLIGLIMCVIKNNLYIRIPANYISLLFNLERK